MSVTTHWPNRVLIGFDGDLAGEAIRLGNRIRGLVTGIHPALEHAIGAKAGHRRCWKSCLAAAARPASPKAGRRKLTAIAKVHGPTLATIWSRRS
ncbi:hypothetical protein JOD54_005289 [Actinokineospora baliensis]|nr:hypothetical protein [Actinokineospora baliensis]